MSVSEFLFFRWTDDVEFERELKVWLFLGAGLSLASETSVDESTEDDSDEYFVCFLCGFKNSFLLLFDDDLFDFDLLSMLVGVLVTDSVSLSLVYLSEPVIRSKKLLLVSVRLFFLLLLFDLNSYDLSLRLSSFEFFFPFVFVNCSTAIAP